MSEHGAQSLPLQGKSALVTGASRGIGAAVSLALAAAGARVALLARTRAALDDVAMRAGNDSFPVECDLSSAASTDSAVEVVRATLGGPPDILVNNAGLFTIRGVEDTTVADFDSIIATNLRAPFVMIHAFLADMRARGYGHIVTIGSVGDRTIYAGNAAYSATKFGARAMHEVLREETRGSGVRATLVSPAAVSTDIWDPIQYFGTDVRPDRSSMLDVSAVARAVVYAVSEASQVNVDELRLSRS
ncbi:MAG TPA: SDR family oxidoreductase [Gemmatimonadaceae bacterium]|nr:SDR family oxidoreductase [Gemmatimonadaceae bacterium]